MKFIQSIVPVFSFFLGGDKVYFSNCCHFLCLFSDDEPRQVQRKSCKAQTPFHPPSWSHHHHQHDGFWLKKMAWWWFPLLLSLSGWEKWPGDDFHSYFHFQAEKNGLVMISTFTFTFRLRKMAWWWSTSSHTSSPAAITLRLTTWSVRPRIFYTFKEDINYHLFKDQSI